MSCVSDTKLHKKQIIAVFSRIRELPTSFSGVNIEHCPVFHFTIFSILLVMTVQKLYPRGTVRRIVKAHSNRSVSKNADILVRGHSYMTPSYYLVPRLLILSL